MYLCVQHDGDGADDNDVSSCVHDVYVCVCSMVDMELTAMM